MGFEGIRVLVLEGYARQSLPVMRALKELGCKVSVLCNSKMDIAYASRIPDEKILGICDTEKYTETEECIRNLLKTGRFDVVIPLVDFSEKILAYNKDEFSNYAKVLSNSKEVFDVAQDKLSVMKLCEENGIPHPKTVFDAKTAEEVLEKNLMFPIIVKPRRDCGARGILHFNTEKEFLDYTKKKDVDFEGLVIQEYIPQDLQNMSANLFVDKDGNVKSNYMYASYRWFPVKGGTGTFNITVDEPKARESAEKLVKIAGIRGLCGVDFIKDPRDGKAKVLEINPRIMACAKIGFLAGVNQIKQALENEFSDNVTEMLDYKKDMRVRMSQVDFLWFIKSPDRFRAKPSWFSMKNTKDQTFSWDDPLPWIAFLLQGLKRYKKEIDRRS